MALSSPASLLKAWFRAVRKHPSASEDLPALEDPKHPLSTEPSPTRWTVTAQGAHPDADPWKNRHSDLDIAADRVGRAGSAHPGWQPSTKMAQQRLGQRPSLLQRSMARQAASGRDGGEREVGEKKNDTCLLSMVSSSLHCNSLNNPGLNLEGTSFRCGLHVLKK